MYIYIFCSHFLFLRSSKIAVDITLVNYSVRALMLKMRSIIVSEAHESLKSTSIYQIKRLTRHCAFSVLFSEPQLFSLIVVTTVKFHIYYTYPPLLVTL